MGKKTEKTFDEKMKRLEEIVEILDGGNAPLEELLRHFEEGMQLAKVCRDYLDKAELNVIEISKQSESFIKSREQDTFDDEEIAVTDGSDE